MKHLYEFIFLFCLCLLQLVFNLKIYFERWKNKKKYTNRQIYRYLILSVLLALLALVSIIFVYQSFEEMQF